MDELYDHDFVLWTEEQAAALRHADAARTNLPLDWENLAEEIESLGKSQRAALRSQLRRILRHLFKLAASPAGAPRRGWETSIRDARVEIEDILQDSPSLRRDLERFVVAQTPVAAELAAADLREHAESTDAVEARLQAGGFTTDQVMGDWFPDAPD
ncbi:MAG: DUF29 domain-containing protein [Alphaproteobacteria bacterium]|nr:DUF29 domain-containing protein [Alphaproteobacteria bacterium]